MTGPIDIWNHLHDGSPLLTTALSRGARILVLLVLAVVAKRFVVRMLRRTYARRLTSAADARGVEELARIKRQSTFVTLLESVIRYGMYGAAAVIAVNIAQPGALTLTVGASVAFALALGSQKLLGDVVAGALLLFEGQFAVGDVLTVHGTNVTGVVEDFSLRTTTLRTHGGDRVTILNGNLTAFTRWSYGQVELRMELLARSPVGAARARAVAAREAASPAPLWLRAPQLEVVDDALDTASPVAVPADVELGGAADTAAATSAVRLRGSIVVAPGHEAVGAHFVSMLQAELGDELLGDVLTVPLHESPYEMWRATLLLRD